jgi:hypothetical protein
MRRVLNVAVVSLAAWTTINTNISAQFYRQRPTMPQRSYQAPQVSPRPYQAPQVSPRPYQAPQVSPRPYQTPQFSPRPYQSPQVQQRPYQSPQVQQRPYQSPQVQQRPYQSPQAQQRPYQSPQVQQRPYRSPQVQQRPYQSPQVQQRPYQSPQLSPRTYQSRARAIEQADAIVSRQSHATAVGDGSIAGTGPALRRVNRPTGTPQRPSQSRARALEQANAIVDQQSHAKAAGNGSVMGTGPSLRRANRPTGAQQAPSQSRARALQQANALVDHQSRALAWQFNVTGPRLNARQELTARDRRYGKLPLEPVNSANLAKLTPTKREKFDTLLSRINKQQLQARIPSGKHEPHPQRRPVAPRKGNLTTGNRDHLRNLAKQDPKLNTILSRLHHHKPLFKPEHDYLTSRWNGSRDPNGAPFGKLLRPTGKPMPNLVQLRKRYPGLARHFGKLNQGIPLMPLQLNDLKLALHDTTGFESLEFALAVRLARELEFNSSFLDSMEANFDVADGGQLIGVPVDPGDDFSPVMDGYALPDDPGTPDGPGVAMGTIPDSGVSPDGGAVPDQMADLPETPDPGILDETGEQYADIGPAADSADLEQSTRYLRVANCTEEPVKLYLQYEGRTQDGQWQWIPGRPGEAGDAETYDIGPGEVMDLADNGWRINAARVRLWAKAGDRDLVQFKDKDLWLVPETNTDGAPGYESAEIQTFFFAIY